MRNLIKQQQHRNQRLSQAIQSLSNWKGNCNQNSFHVQSVDLPSWSSPKSPTVLSRSISTRSLNRSLPSRTDFGRSERTNCLSNHSSASAFTNRFFSCSIPARTAETGNGIRAQSKDLRSNPNIGTTHPSNGSATGAFSGAPKRHDLPQVNRRRTELPNAPDRRPILIIFVLVSIASWSLFASYANNKERLSTSVFRSVLVQLKDDPEVKRRLGDPVMLVPSRWGEPWVNGGVNMMQGKVDISFKIKGSKGIEATAYFTSIRRSSRGPFEILRFLVIPDSPSSKEGPEKVDTSPISLLGDADIADGEVGDGNSASGARLTAVHDDQGELSLRRS